MDGIDKILERIQQDFQQELTALEGETQGQLAQRSAHYDALIAQETAAILARGREEAAQHEERLVSVAMVDCRKTTLSTRQALIGQAFDQALSHLTSLPEEEYITLLATLIARGAQSGKEEVILSEQDRTRYGKTVVAKANELMAEGKGNLSLSPQTRNILGGVILSDGQVELNCTVETLVRLQRGVMDLAVAQVLFPQ